MRAVLIALCGLMLTACNMVVSHDPIFTKADQDKAAPMKDGWWGAPEKDCDFDLKGDARDWPKCADSQLIRGGRMIDDDGEIDFILTAGDPRIMQVGIKEKGFDLYAYAGMKPAGHDAQGRLTAAVTWPIQCGPPPPEPKNAKGPADYATRSPVAGLKVDKETGNCWTTQAAQVRAAAVASAGWTKDKKEIHWIRAMLPGEDVARPKPPEAPAESPANDDPDKLR